MEYHSCNKNSYPSMCTNTKYTKYMHKYEIQRVCAQIRNTKSVCTDTNAKTLIVLLGKMQCYFLGGWGELFIFMAQNTKLHHLDRYRWDQALHRNALYYRVCAATFKLTVPEL